MASEVPAPPAQAVDVHKERRQSPSDSMDPWPPKESYHGHLPVRTGRESSLGCRAS